MNRKRKQSDVVVTRTRRPRPTAGPQNRTVSVYKTATGRLGQTTSYLPAPEAAMLAESVTIDVPDEVDIDINTDPGTSEDPGTLGDGSDSAEDSEEANVNGYGPRRLSRLLDWATNHRQHYLDELLRHDGRAGCNICVDCEGDGVYKCDDCFGFQLRCQSCFVERHAYAPFHRALVSVVSC